MEALSDPIVGIDLGTSNSVVAHADGAGPVQVFADDGGYKIHPSVVSFHPAGGVVVGAAAKQRKVIDPQNTIYSVKRLIGRGYRSPEVQTAKARVPFQIKEGEGQMPMIATRGGEFAVPEISAIVLDHVRNIAAARLGTAVTRAVVTVPASFGDVQRSATATAGAIAGLTVVRLLNEPTAAALAYGHARALHDVIAVYDFGGGTFDVSILKLDDQVYEVLGTAGDTFLGGDDLDERLVDKMVAKFLADHRVDLRTNEVAMMRLRAVAEQTKIELSRRARAVVRVDEIAYGQRGAPLNLQIEISRDEFVREVGDLIDRTFPVCQEALQLAGVTLDRVGDVLLVGGTTKIPHVREQVGRFFQKTPRADVGPEDAVAIGAALQGAALERTLTRPRAASSRGEPRDPDESTTTTTETLELEPSGAVRTSSALIAPGADRARHATSGAFDARESSEPSVTRPDTSYSVTRAGTKDTYDGRAPSPLPGLFDDLTPPPQGQPIGRMSRPPTVDPEELGPPAAPQARTLFGVPQGPAPRAASSTLDIPTLHPTTQPTMPAAARPPNPTSWGDEDGKVRPPPPPQSPTSEVTAARPPPVPARSPPPVPTASPSAPTMFGAPLEPALSGPSSLSDPAAASTAKGFGAPPPPRPPVVLEVTPRGLGIGTVAGYCEELIRRNSRVPAEMKKLFTTSRDHQDVVRIVVCQGESRRLDHNVVIGDLVLAGLPPRPRGETSIEVTFSLDASGILQVHARDALTGTEQRAELDLIGSMSQQDVAASRDRLQLLRR
jgi:molecular chaperone DnaK